MSAVTETPIDAALYCAACGQALTLCEDQKRIGIAIGCCHECNHRVSDYVSALLSRVEAAEKELEAYRTTSLTPRFPEQDARAFVDWWRSPRPPEARDREQEFVTACYSYNPVGERDGEFAKAAVAWQAATDAARALSRSRLGELRATANDLIRQRDEARGGWIELAEILGCIEEDDSVSGAVRDLKKRAEEAERGERELIALWELLRGRTAARIECSAAVMEVHRCLKHIGVAVINRNESSGAECGGCILESWETEDRSNMALIQSLRSQGWRHRIDELEEQVSMAVANFHRLHLRIAERREVAMEMVAREAIAEAWCREDDEGRFIDCGLSVHSMVLDTSDDAAGLAEFERTAEHINERHRLAEADRLDGFHARLRAALARTETEKILTLRNVMARTSMALRQAEAGISDLQSRELTEEGAESAATVIANELQEALRDEIKRVGGHWSDSDTMAHASFVNHLRDTILSARGGR